jgi:hypothetical protein
MTYQYARIDLAKTTYQPTVDYRYLSANDESIVELNNIYRTYCIYKHFASVMPMFLRQYTDPMTDIIGYYDNNQLVAFSLIKRFDNDNALCEQFAWTYHKPRMRLGIESLITECAIYRERGFQYLYLDQAHLYKQGLEGFELLGPHQ